MRFAWGVSLAVLVVARLGAAQTVPMATRLQEVGTKNIAYLTIWCDYVDKETASCTFVTTYVQRPTGEEIRNRIAAFRSADARKELARDLSKCQERLRQQQTPARMAEMSAPERRLLQSLIGPCERQDVDAYLAALDLYVREVDAKTCRVSTSLPKTKTFKQKTADVWEGIDVGEPGRGGTVVMTIFRDPNGFWNYREVQAGETDCSKALYCRKPGIIEWRWDAPKPLLECGYVVNN
jgi:hypothetical protein